MILGHVPPSNSASQSESCNGPPALLRSYCLVNSWIPVVQVRLLHIIVLCGYNIFSVHNRNCEMLG